MADASVTLDISQLSAQGLAALRDAGVQAYQTLHDAAKGDIRGIVGAGTLAARGLEIVGLTKVEDAVNMVTGTISSIAAGAAAGTTVLPGLGTVVGGAVAAALAIANDIKSILGGQDTSDPRPPHIKAVQEATIPPPPCLFDPKRSETDNLILCLPSKFQNPEDDSLVGAGIALCWVLWDKESRDDRFLPKMGMSDPATPTGLGDPSGRAGYPHFVAQVRSGSQGVPLFGNIGAPPEGLSKPQGLQGSIYKNGITLTRAAQDAEIVHDGIGVNAYVGSDVDGWQSCLSRLTRWSPFGFDVVGQEEVRGRIDAKSFRLLHKLAMIAIVHEVTARGAPKGAFTVEQGDEIVLQYFLRLASTWQEQGPGITIDPYIATMIGHLNNLVRANQARVLAGKPSLQGVGGAVLRGNKDRAASSLQGWVDYYNGRGPEPGA